MIKEQLHHSILRLIKAVGVWTCGCLMLSLLILAVTYIRVGAIVNNDALELVKLSGRQRMLVAEMTKSALEIEIALRAEDWDALEPTLESLTADRMLWQESHESLKTSRQNNFSDAGSKATIRDYFDKIDYPYAQISQAVDEIEVVTKSVIRRAPYIDLRSHDRIAAAAHTMRSHESGFLSNMGEIVTLYELNASKSATQAVWAVHKSLLFLLAALTGTLIIGIAPRYRLLVAKNTRLESDIQRAHEAANKRWHFLASLGHEFRTPMSTIMGFAGLLANEDQDQATKEQHAGTILGSGRGLMTLIEDIIDMSAIEADELQVTPNPTNPRQILEKLERTFAPQAKDKDLEFRTFFDESCPASITTDNKRLKQILTNVVGNAIKFTKTGSVDINASLESIDGNEMFVIRVADTGIGIEFKDINRIFEPFERVETGMIRDYAGAGLGLTIARALTRRLGGDLTIDSALGAGCFVTIAIDPGEYIEQSDDANAAQEEVVIDRGILEGKLVLLVEDGEDNQRLLTHFLTKAGCSVHLAENGQVAIDHVEKFAGSEKPVDIILMDMQMPVMDGFEATSILREDGITIPIIGVTAHSSEDDRQRCLSAGCDEYLSKPVKNSLLLDTCALWITKHIAENQSDNQQPKKAA